MRLRTLRRGTAWSLAVAGLVSLVSCTQTPTTVAGPPATPQVRTSASTGGHPDVVSAKPRNHRAGTPHVRHVSRRFLGPSWHPGCPVAPSDLRAVTLAYVGFDGHRHAGTIVVNADAVNAIQTVFGRLRRAHFPVRRMRPVSDYGASDQRSVRHDNTSAFNCRYAVAHGPKHWSEHAFGEAVDLDPWENPYLLSGSSLPRSRARYADRSKVRRGMIVTGGPAVRAFDAVGWGWGGRWAAPDFQHFSVNGR